MDNLSEIIEKVRAQLSEKHGAREEGLRLSREAIRHCANSIRATHRGEFGEAEGAVGEGTGTAGRGRGVAAGASVHVPRGVSP